MSFGKRSALLAFVSVFFAFTASSGAGAAPRNVEDPEETSSAFLAEYPHLKDLFAPPAPSRFMVGLGASPFIVLSNRLAVGVSPIQLHWRTERMDWEVANATIMLALGSGASATRHFILRTVPKFRFFRIMSVGPIAGVEFISFPDVKSRLTLHDKVGNTSTVGPYEPFSSLGVVYGAALTETLPLEGEKAIRISQSWFRQNYRVNNPSTTQWGYEFKDREIQNDPEHTVLKGGDVFLLEFSLLF